MKVIEIEMSTTNGYTYPVFITEDNKRFVARNTPTGHCWVTDWVEEEHLQDK